MGKSNKENQLKNFARYTSIGIQMMVTIIGGYYLGGYIDEEQGYTTPFYQKWIGLAAVFIAVASVLWQVIKTTSKSD